MPKVTRKSIARHYCCITTFTLVFPAIPPGNVKQVVVFVAVIGPPAAAQD
jgi:hypothetical protein